MAKGLLLKTPEAEQDLLEIWSFVALHSSPVIADAMLARILGALDVLGAFPLVGRRRTDMNGKPRGLPARPYVVFYEPLPERKGVLV